MMQGESTLKGKEQLLEAWLHCYFSSQFFIGQRVACLLLQKGPDLPESRKVLGMASSEECSNGTIIIDGSIMEGVI